MSEGVLITDALDKILETSWAILVAVLPLFGQGRRGCDGFLGVFYDLVLVFVFAL